MTPNEMVNAHPESISIFVGVILLIGVVVIILALWGEVAGRTKMEEQSIFRTTLSWIFFWLGDGVSRLSRILPDHRVFDFVHHSYGRLMNWSVDLDKAGKVWDHIDEEE